MTEAAATSTTLAAARDAALRHAWEEAFELYQEADRSDGLAPADLAALGEVAWWSGRLDAAVDARERAYAAYRAAGDRVRAAWIALRLSRDHAGKGARSAVQGWRGMAERLLADEPESPVHGWLALSQPPSDRDEFLRRVRWAEELGRRFGDRDLEVCSRCFQAEVLIAQGEVEAGADLFDEAAAAAGAGELTPEVAGLVYCVMINACRGRGDLARAAEWTEATIRWCERESITGFPGVCRVHRAESMRLSGAWAEAEAEARRACEELASWGTWGMTAAWAKAEAYCEIGEIRLRMGDYIGADEAFRQASEVGHTSYVGIALLRLAEGRIDEAVECIQSALAGESSPLARARMLSAWVEIAVAAADLESAAGAADELERIAQSSPTSAFEAAAACARGSVALGQGDAPGAAGSLRRGFRLWRETGAPYEAAEARMLLAQALRMCGERAAAAVELEAATTTFERLGAAPAARRCGELLSRTRRREGRREARTLMFTDICRSTTLVDAIGDDAWKDVVEWHDRTLRSHFTAHGGEEIDHAGDGFFVSFLDAGAALDCAVAVQRALSNHRRAHGFAPEVRIGVHVGEATRTGGAYRGKVVHEASRIATEAGPAEIVASRAAIEAAGPDHVVSHPRTVTLKGIAAPVEIVSVDWR